MLDTNLEIAFGTPIDEIVRKITQLEIERTVLLKEHDALSEERLEKVLEELKKLKKEEEDYRKTWESEKAEIQKTKDLKKKAPQRLRNRAKFKSASIVQTDRQ